MLNRRAFLALPFVSLIAKLLPKPKPFSFADGGEIPKHAPYLVGENASCRAPLGYELNRDLTLWGNHFRFLKRDSEDRVIAMRRLEPERMVVVRREDGRIGYRYRVGHGLSVDLDRDVLHLFRDASGNLNWRGLAS